jgi:hypothetical protein
MCLLIKGDGKFRNIHVVIWVQLNIVRKIQVCIILNPNHNKYITESAIPFQNYSKNEYDGLSPRNWRILLHSLVG